MADVCQIIPSTGSFASNLLAFLDCEASTLGSGGYQTLSSSAGTGSVLLGTLLTIFVALWGYRLLLGSMPSVSDLVLAAVKVGVVLVLALSWPAYQALVYNAVLNAPAQIASDIGASHELPGSGGGLATRLDGAETAYRQLEILGPGQPRSVEQQAQLRQTVPPPLFANFDTFAIGSARLTFLVSTLGSFALVRLAAGILLALAPLFAGLLLFDAARWLFLGWIKGLVAIALASMATSVILGVELALLEPWLQQLLAIRLADNPILGVPAQLLAVSLIFAAALSGVIFILVRIATSGTSLLNISRLADTRLAYAGEAGGNSIRGQRAPETERARALVVADAIMTAQRRESVSISGARPFHDFGMRGTTSPERHEERPSMATGASFRRRTGGRISARARERDLRS